MIILLSNEREREPERNQHTHCIKCISTNIFTLKRKGDSPKYIYNIDSL